MRIVLGSSSKWRRELAAKYFDADIELMSPDIDEKDPRLRPEGISPSSLTAAISRAKLDDLLKRIEGEAVVMCFDTVTVHSGRILEKPVSNDQGLEMIESWSTSGSILTVWTSIAVGNKATGEVLQRSLSADVVMDKTFTKADIKEYLKDKYCMQSSGALIVEKLLEMSAAHVDGSQSVIEGFPVPDVVEMVNKVSK